MILYYDFTDTARATLGFTKAQSNVVLYDKAGAVQFAFAGALPTDKRKELADLIRANMATLTPPPAAP
jgi:predicted transcriptional regulator